jgi:opacity protein-like surface antigen
MIPQFARIPRLIVLQCILLLALAGVPSTHAQQTPAQPTQDQQTPAQDPAAPPPQAEPPQAGQQSSSSQETQEEVGPIRKKKQAHPYNKWTFNVGGGASLTNGNTKNFVRGGGGVAAVGAARNANRYLGLRLDFQFDNLPLRTSALESAQSTSANNHAYTLMLDPIINIPVTSNWGGYVLGGPTFLHRSGQLDNSSAIPGSACNTFFLWWGNCFNNSLPIDGKFAHASQNEFGANFGGGITRKLTPKFELYAEFRYVHGKHNGITTDIRPITVGLRW